MCDLVLRSSFAVKPTAPKAAEKSTVKALYGQMGARRIT